MKLQRNFGSTREDFVIYLKPRVVSRLRKRMFATTSTTSNNLSLDVFFKRPTMEPSTLTSCNFKRFRLMILKGIWQGGPVRKIWQFPENLQFSGLPKREAGGTPSDFFCGEAFRRWGVGVGSGYERGTPHQTTLR